MEKRLCMRPNRMRPLVGLTKSEDVTSTPGMIPHRQVLHLQREDGTQGSVTIPLFEPTFEKINAGGIVQLGYEINAEDNVATQYVQVWLITPRPVYESDVKHTATNTEELK